MISITKTMKEEEIRGRIMALHLHTNSIDFTNCIAFLKKKDTTTYF